MNRPHAYRGPDFRDPTQRRAATAGLTQRQIREKAEERQTVLLPVYVVPWVPDKKASK